MIVSGPSSQPTLILMANGHGGRRPNSGVKRPEGAVEKQCTVPSCPQKFWTWPEIETYRLCPDHRGVGPRPYYSDVTYQFGYDTGRVAPRGSNE